MGMLLGKLCGRHIFHYNFHHDIDENNAIYQVMIIMKFIYSVMWITSTTWILEFCKNVA